MSEKVEARDEDELSAPIEEHDRTEADESEGGEPGQLEKRVTGGERCPWAAMEPRRVR